MTEIKITITGGDRDAHNMARAGLARFIVFPDGMMRYIGARACQWKALDALSTKQGWEDVNLASLAYETTLQHFGPAGTVAFENRLQAMFITMLESVAAENLTGLDTTPANYVR